MNAGKKIIVHKKNDGAMVKQIDGNTHVIFTMKNFFALISTILGLFFGFYMLVVEPRLQKTEEHYDMMYQEQKELNKVFMNEIIGIKLKMNFTSENLLVKDSIASPIKDEENGGSVVPYIPSQANNGSNNILANITRYR